MTGYVLASADIAKSDWLVGLGINDDWSFESDFIAQNKVPVDAYDASVNSKLFWTRFETAYKRSRKLKDSAWLFSPFTMWRAHRTSKRMDRNDPNRIAADHWWTTWRDYLRFFRGQRRHHQQFVGDPTQDNTIAFTRTLNRANQNSARAIFLKIDIEGSEYAILDELIKAAPRTSGLVIELHHCRKHVETLRDFIERYPLRLVHTHVNNNSRQDDDGLPFAIELSFTSEPAPGAEFVHPHPKDMINNVTLPDYQMCFDPE